MFNFAISVFRYSGIAWMMVSVDRKNITRDCGNLETISSLNSPEDPKAYKDRLIKWG